MAIWAIPAIASLLFGGYMSLAVKDLVEKEKEKEKALINEALKNTPNAEQPDDYFDLQELLNQRLRGMHDINRQLEYDMYRAIGLQQQQVEQEIRRNRMNALKSGATSAQLAAQELQTMLAAQQGAQTIAREMAKQRLGFENELADYALNLANLDVQRYAADQSFRAMDPIDIAQRLQFSVAKNPNLKEWIKYLYPDVK